MNKAVQPLVNGVSETWLNQRPESLDTATQVVANVVSEQLPEFANPDSFVMPDPLEANLQSKSSHSFGS
jgi:hypothetical protein